jgi:SAM-dependent methyltransferase
MSERGLVGWLQWLRRLFANLSVLDVGLFAQSARTDGTISRLRPEIGQRATFETIYDGLKDPWASGSHRYRYQRRKYQDIVTFLPAGRRFARALDLGCGLGLLSTLLAERADAVLGLDIAEAAVALARVRAGAIGNVTFDQGDVQNLSQSLDGQFDLVVIADTLYYLPPPLHDDLLKGIVARVADLLAPGGLCLIANHYFFAGDTDSRQSRRIHDAFSWSPRFQLMSESRRPFFLLSILAGC